MNTILNMVGCMSIENAIDAANTRYNFLLERSRTQSMLLSMESKSYSKDLHKKIEEDLEKEDKFIRRLQSIQRTAITT